MISGKQESIHEPAGMQKRFGLLCLLVVAAIALLTLSGSQAAAQEPETKYSVLYNFTGGADGFFPGGVIRDEAGNLYGTTWGGGTEGTCLSVGCGVVFKLDRNGKYTVLYSYTGGADGGHPRAGVIRDKAGNLYGTTENGGLSCSPVLGFEGCGVVFNWIPLEKRRCCIASVVVRTAPVPVLA